MNRGIRQGYTISPKQFTYKEMQYAKLNKRMRLAETIGKIKLYNMKIKVLAQCIIPVLIYGVETHTKKVSMNYK